MNAEIFYHLYCVNDGLQRFLKTYRKIEKSNLINQTKTINVSLVGVQENIDEYDTELKNLNKVKISKFNYNTGGEMNTLKLLQSHCENNIDIPVLYLHSKGVTKVLDENVQSWVDYMEYFLIEKFELCFEKLKLYDTVGVNLQKDPLLHYSGNFWWSNSNYIKKLCSLDYSNLLLPAFLNERLYCEFWLFDKVQPKACTLHQSDVNHYHSTYPREKYLKD